MVATEVRGFRETMLEIRNLDALIFKEVRRNIESSAAPLATKIQQAIPTNSPFASGTKDGFAHQGRTSWQSSENKVRVKTSFVKPRADRPTSLLKIVIDGVGISIVDMAGRKGGGKTPSGKALITALKSKVGRASRYLYPAASKNMNLIEATLRRALEDASAIANKNLLTKPRI
jgi:hypothetical protein